ncbi:MAG TPA: hypothetical protein DCQ98_09740 [Planctomycetaceae bacterium]|nr:hypothetical protein [Planctomycetaceae bacterium]
MDRERTMHERGRDDRFRFVAIRSLLAALLLAVGFGSANGQESDLLQSFLESLQRGESLPDANTIAGQRGSVRPERLHAPLGPPPMLVPADVISDGDTFTVRAPSSTIGEVVGALARTSAVDIVLAGDGNTPVSLNMTQRRLDEILNALCMLTGHTWQRFDGTILVSPLDQARQVDPTAQGKSLRAIELQYVAAADLQLALQNLLTPVGKIHVLTSEAADHLKAREVIIIEDLAGNVERLAEFVSQLDTPPRQVLIEAYVFQVELKDDERHGVNFERLASLAGVPLSIEMTGFANPAASQALLARVDGISMNAVLEALRVHTDSRTLASPRLMVINGQERNLQVGDQLGYRTITTNASGLTQENVQFLSVGVILKVRPRISSDGRIMLEVNSKVSSGAVNPNTGLPEESTSEIDTDVLLEDGHGIVVGGLIQEEDTLNRSGVPFLSDLKWIGPLFTRRETIKRRSEIVFAILPRIVQDPRLQPLGHDGMYQRATTPIFPCTDLPSASFGPQSQSDTGESMLDIEGHRSESDWNSDAPAILPVPQPSFDSGHAFPDETAPNGLSSPFGSRRQRSPVAPTRYAPESFDRSESGPVNLAVPASLPTVATDSGLWSDPRPNGPAVRPLAERSAGRPSDSLGAARPNIARLPQIVPAPTVYR